MHKIVISGGLGLLGQRIIRHIFSTGLDVRVLVVDTATPPVHGFDSAGSTAAGSGDRGGGDGDGGSKDEVLPGLSLKAEIVRGDLACPHVAAAIKSFASGGGCADSSATAAATTTPSSLSLSSSLSVFHLASVMSGQGEQDFDEALRVNIDGADETIVCNSKQKWLKYL